MPDWHGPVSVIGFVFAVWLVYLAIKVAQHVNAWPF